MRRSHSHATHAAGTYGSTHRGASMTALPVAATTATPVSCTRERPIRSTALVGPMARKPRLAPRRVSSSAANGSATASALSAVATSEGRAPAMTELAMHKDTRHRRGGQGQGHCGGDRDELPPAGWRCGAPRECGDVVRGNAAGR